MTAGTLNGTSRPRRTLAEIQADLDGRTTVPMLPSDEQERIRRAVEVTDAAGEVFLVVSDELAIIKHLLRCPDGRDAAEVIRLASARAHRRLVALAETHSDVEAPINHAAALCIAVLASAAMILDGDTTAVEVDDGEYVAALHALRTVIGHNGGRRAHEEFERAALRAIGEDEGPTSNRRSGRRPAGGAS